MTTRILGRWIAGCVACFALVFTTATNQAADDPKTEVTKAEEAWPTQRTTIPEDLDELKALETRVKGVVDECSPCTIAVLVGFGAGSGVIVSEDGLVLTAAHVIAGDTRRGKSKYKSGQSCTLILNDGRRVKGKTLGINEKYDSGMVQITDKGPNDGKWPFIPLAKSEDLKPGQWVVSLGHPGGPKSGRSPVARLGQIEPPERHRWHKGFVVSNCTLVGGDSGGPLFDLDGKVIGIHSRIGLTLSTNVHVPSDKFKDEWDDLVAGKVIGEKPDEPEGYGAVMNIVLPDDEEDDAWIVEIIEDGPAAKAGMLPGDTITKIDGKRIKSVKQLREVLLQKKPAQVIKVTFRRGVEIRTEPLTLGKRGE